jgi:hypothetical protein
MAIGASGFTREVPKEFLATLRNWRRWSLMYYWLNLSLGAFSVLLCSAYASNAGMNGSLFNKQANPYLGGVAALLTFLLTVGKPSARYAAYRAAYYELDKAILAFRHDSNHTDKDLADAEVRAVDMLDRIKTA